MSPYPVAAVRGYTQQQAAAGAGALLSEAAIAALVSWWSLNEESGNRADAHGSNTLTDINTVGFAAGKQGNAADIESATAEYLSIADGDAAGLKPTSSFTCFGWVKPESITAAYNTIVSYAINSGNFAGYILRSRDNSITEYTWYLYAGGSYKDVVSTVVPVAGTWAFVAAWYDSSDEKLYISVNNETPVSTAGGSLALPASQPFYVGNDATSPTRYFDGLIDEAGVFIGYAMTADDRTALYNSGDGITHAQAVGA